MIWLIFIVIILILYIIGTYNKMISKKNKLVKADGTLDVMLKKRYDLIPNIVECTKAYSNYEQETLEKIMSIRTKAHEINNLKDYSKIDEDYGKYINDVNGIIENYPEIKANEAFINLQKTLKEVEDEIAAARRTYNAHVEEYNTYISIFPNSILAKIFKFKAYDFYDLDEKEKNFRIG